jgi:hypothetical protein
MALKSTVRKIEIACEVGSQKIVRAQSLAKSISKDSVYNLLPPNSSLKYESRLLSKKIREGRWGVYFSGKSSLEELESFSGLIARPSELSSRRVSYSADKLRFGQAVKNLYLQVGGELSPTSLEERFNEFKALKKSS